MDTWTSNSSMPDRQKKYISIRTPKKNYETNAAIWYNKICKQFHPDPARKLSANLYDI
jgi:hypothetical protein